MIFEMDKEGIVQNSKVWMKDKVHLYKYELLLMNSHRHDYTEES